MKPWELLGETRAPDGTLLALTRRDREYVILAGGRSLMSSRMHGSEEALATLGCAHARTSARPCVLVGGLGMGFTLRATLDLLPPEAIVIVAELLPAVVEWNREVLGAARRPSAEGSARARDRRRRRGHAACEPRRFDAVLLDVDNGPDAFTAAANGVLYSDRGVAAIVERSRAAACSPSGRRGRIGNSSSACATAGSTSTCTACARG